jgi:hypothetical protein
LCKEYGSSVTQGQCWQEEGASDPLEEKVQQEQKSDLRGFGLNISNAHQRKELKVLSVTGSFIFAYPFFLVWKWPLNTELNKKPAKK